VIYRILKSGTHDLLDEVQDANWPLIKNGDQIPVMIEGQETLCRVVETSSPGIGQGNRLVITLYVTDLPRPSN